MESGWASVRNIISTLGLGVAGSTLSTMLLTEFSIYGGVVVSVALLVAILSSESLALFLCSIRLRGEFLSSLFLPRLKSFIPITLLVSFIVSLASQYYQDQGLKQRALSLSADIFAFVKTSETKKPSEPRPETWRADSDKIVKYYQDMMVDFSAIYIGRVRALCMQLAERGLGDQRFQSNCENPVVTTFQIQEIAGQLAAFAEQLPKMENWFSRRWALSFCLSFVCSFLLWVVLGVLEQRASDRLSLQGNPRDPPSVSG